MRLPGGLCAKPARRRRLKKGAGRAPLRGAVQDKIWGAMRETSVQKRKDPCRARAWWALALLAAAAAAGALVYFWRVFYYLDARGVPALPLYLGAAGLACLAVGAAALGHFVCKRFEAKAVLAVALCGALFCFANPPPANAGRDRPFSAQLFAQPGALHA